MSAIAAAVDYVLKLGPSVMMPIIITLFGLLLRQGLVKSFRAGLITGVGFVGIGLAVGLLVDQVGPQAMAFSRALHLKLDVLDVGWPVGAAASFASPIALVLIPAILALNVAMLFLRATRTMDVDLWNYWHFIYTGALVQQMYKMQGRSEGVALAAGVGAACVTAIIIFKLADWTAPAVEKHFGLKGISLPHTETVNWAPFMYALERVESRIPGFNKLHLDPAKIRARAGILGEPVVMGALLGLVLGGFGGWPLLATGGPGAAGAFVKNALTLAVAMAAVLVILPRMVAILMEGLIPVAEGAREFIQKRFPGKNVYIGLDAAVVIAHPAGMAVALLLVPISLALAVALPGNRMLPFADLAVLAFYIIWAVACSRGNLVRGLLNGVIVMVCILYIGSDLAGLTTALARNAGFIPKAAAGLTGYAEWSGIAVGSHVVPWMLLRLLDFGSRQFWIALGVAVLFGACWWWVRDDIRRQFPDAAASAPPAGGAGAAVAAGTGTEDHAAKTPAL
ncbi:MAG TPA: PTS transporter subunit IIC [Myxococcota bacterium]|jgi:PTS system galactitol-specific IIC component|nr:PTS transporter subunit IIC [Myxococcota bacterium]